MAEPTGTSRKAAGVDIGDGLLFARRKASHGNARWRDRLVLAIGVVLLAVVVAATHWPALSATAHSFDHDQYLGTNTLVKHPTWAGAWRFVSEVVRPSTVRGYYQPLTMLSLMLDSRTGAGLQNMGGYHRTSLAFHVANSVLLAVLLYLLFGNAPVALLAALLFGVHPMTVENIPWVGERKTLLATFFALLSLICYVRFARAAHIGKLAWMSGCVLAFMLALLAKPTATMLPLCMLLLDYWPLGRLRPSTLAGHPSRGHMPARPRRHGTQHKTQPVSHQGPGWMLLWEKMPLFVVAGVSAVITYYSQKLTGGVFDPQERGGAMRVPLVLCHNIVFYLRNMLWPVNLSSQHLMPEPMNLTNNALLIGVIGTAVLMAALLLSWSRTRAAITGWLFFFVAIFPTMGIVGFTKTIASDKYAYLPMVGMVLALAALGDWLWRRGANLRTKRAMQAGLVAFALVASGVLAVLAYRYEQVWKDSLSLHEHMVKVSGEDSDLRNGLGNAYFYAKRYDEAIVQYQRSVKLTPNNFRPVLNIGVSLYEKGRLADAAGQQDDAKECYTDSVKYLRQVIDMRGGAKVRLDWAACNSLGLSLIAIGQFDEAEQWLNRSSQLNPDAVEPLGNLGRLKLQKGQPDKALELFGKALEIAPTYQLALDGRAKALEQLNKP